MAVTDSVDYYRPQLRPDIIIGPAVQSGVSVVYHLKDEATNRFFRVGRKEQFLLSRLDGQRSLQQIGAEYAAVFNRTLDEQAWQGLFRLLTMRQMLAGMTDAAKLAETRREIAQQRNSQRRGWFHPLVDPDRFLTRLLPWVRFAFRPTFVIPAVLITLVINGLVLANLAQIGAAAWSLRQNYGAILLLGGLFWLVTALHEVAHGLTCHYFGGRVSEMGIMLRHMMLMPYTSVDDIFLFHARRHRVYTACAGIFVTFLFIPLFGLLWWLVPDGVVWHAFSAAALLALNLIALINLLPFFRLDGYFMLNHALGLIDLHKESHQFWHRVLDGGLKGGGNGIRDYPFRIRVVYLIYGFSSFCFTVMLLAGIAVGLFYLFKFWFA